MPPSTASKRLRTASPDSPQASQSEQPNAIYDPDQPLSARRALQRQLRDLTTQLAVPDPHIAPGSTTLLTILESSNAINKEIRQTTEAAIDSKLQVTVADLLHRKTVSLMQGPAADKLDLDKLVGKVARLVAEGGWESVGQTDGAGGLRPGVPGFLLGPLHSEKKARKATQRAARLNTNALAETRPEVLNTADLTKVDNDLTVLCALVLRTLETEQARIQDALEAQISEDATEEESIALMHQMGLRSTGGIDLMRFVVNPHSYAQTVENTFYLSFLIRDGKVEIAYDDEGVPSVEPVETGDGAEKSGADSRRQCIFTLDQATWKDIVDTFGITRSMIPHRNVRVVEPGASGWFT